MKTLQDKVIAITGAGSGMGRALALQCVQAGAHVALSDIQEAALAETVRLLGAPATRVTSTVLDVGDRAAVEAWAADTAQRHGRVNAIINNAGVALSGTVPGLSIEDYEWIMRINFWGVVYGTKAFLPYLEASGDGHVVNTSSVFGLSAQPLMSGYNAAKFAVRGFTESLRQDLELARSCVSATCVHPGGIKTNIAKAARMDASVQKVTGVQDAAAVKDFERAFITTADQAARVILRGMLNNRRRVLIGPDARVLDWLVRLFPAGYQRLFVAGVRLRSKR